MGSVLEMSVIVHVGVDVICTGDVCELRCDLYW